MEREEKFNQRKKINSLSLPGRLVGEYKAAISYEPSRMFEPVSYREVAAESCENTCLVENFPIIQIFEMLPI